MATRRVRLPVGRQLYRGNSQGERAMVSNNNSMQHGACTLTRPTQAEMGATRVRSDCMTPAECLLLLLLLLHSRLADAWHYPSIETEAM